MPTDRPPEPDPASCTPVEIPDFADGEITPLIAAAVQGVEMMNAYIAAGLTREEARNTMVDLTRPKICSVCRGALH